MTRRLLLIALMCSTFPLAAYAGDWLDTFTAWWLTPDQQGQRLSEKDQFLEAAAVFEDTERKGIAFFRAGDFQSAASVFGRMRSPEAAYNRGNALVMMGQYEEAIKSYEQALELQPVWTEAEENLAIARVRRDKLAPPESDFGGTGGQLEADEIVFDESGRVNKSGSEVETQGGEALSEEEMRAVWLRRVKSNPADFLAARFAYQLYRDQKEPEVEP